MLNRNTASGVMEKALHLTKYKDFQIQENNTQLYYIASVDSDAVFIGITDNFLMNNDGDVFEYEDLVKRFLSIDIVHDVMQPQMAKVSIPKALFEIDEDLVLRFRDTYTSAGTSAEAVVFEGKVSDYVESGQLYNINMDSLAERDFDSKPTGDYSGRSDEIITSILSDHCNYITKGTFSAGTAMGTITFGGGMRLESILDVLAYFENWVWYITPTGVLYFNDGSVDSTINLAETDPVRDVSIISLHERYNKVKVKGAIVGGIQIESEWKEDLELQQLYGVQDYAFETGFLDTVALCNTCATNILTRLKEATKSVNLIHEDTTVGYIQPGETITFEYAAGGFTIGSAQYYNNGIVYNKNSVANYDIQDKLS